MIHCTTDACAGFASVSIEVLVPTGETIETDTGSGPVLKPAMSAALCPPCSAGLPAFEAVAKARGCHVDIVELGPEDHARDPMDAAKAGGGE